MALTSLTGQQSWSGDFQERWRRPGVISPIRPIKFGLRSFYYFARERVFRDMAEPKMSE
jgi:hypothetical protein